MRGVPEREYRYSTIVFILTITHFNIYLDTDWKLFMLNMNARAKALDEDVCVTVRNELKNKCKARGERSRGQTDRRQSRKDR